MRSTLSVCAAVCSISCSYLSSCSKRLASSEVLVILVALNLSVGTAAAQECGEISVRVVSLASNNGEVRFGLYNNEKAFKKGMGASIRKGTCQPKDHKCEFTISDVPCGEYAVIVGHDENRNGKIDWASGERFGFSNYDKKLGLHRPNYEKAKFVHDRQRTALEIPVFSAF